MKSVILIFYISERHIASRWSLIDVYMETSYVLSGLSRKCDLRLLSPESIKLDCSSNSSALKSPSESQGCSIYHSCLSKELLLESSSQLINSPAVRSDNLPLYQHTSADAVVSEHVDNELGPENLADNEVRTDLTLSGLSNGVVNKRKQEDWTLVEQPSWKFRFLDCNTKKGEFEELLEMSRSCEEVVTHCSVGLLEQKRTSNSGFDAGAFDSSVKSSQDTTISEPGRPRQISNDFCETRCIEESSQGNDHALVNHSEGTDQAVSFVGSSVNLDPSLNRSKDLPLMANVDDVLVKHYILDLDVDFEKRVISGTIVLFVEPAAPDKTDCDFQMCLDSTMVTVESAVEIPVPEDFEVHFHKEKCCCTAFMDVQNGKNESLFDSNFGKTCKYSNADSHINSICKESFIDEVPSSCGPRNSQLGDSPAEKSVIENDLIGTGDRTNQLLDPFQNSSISASHTESQYLNAVSSLEAGQVSCNSNKAISNADASCENTVICRHCQFLYDLRGSKQSSNPLKFKKLAYSIHGWCIRIWKEGEDARIWPRCVKLTYHTSPDGQSIMWGKDQDGQLVSRSICALLD